MCPHQEVLLKPSYRMFLRYRQTHFSPFPFPSYVKHNVKVAISATGVSTFGLDWYWTGSHLGRTDGTGVRHSTRASRECGVNCVHLWNPQFQQIFPCILLIDAAVHCPCCLLCIKRIVLTLCIGKECEIWYRTMRGCMYHVGQVLMKESWMTLVYLWCTFVCIFC